MIHTKPNQGNSQSWITPKHVIDALGPFDLDPCCCVPQPWPCAREAYYSNGLEKPWFGRVWLNPPYQRDWSWVRKLGEHGKGTALLAARTETKAFRETVWERADALLFLYQRLYFHLPDGSKKGNSGHPSVLVAYGEEDAQILETCKLKGAFNRGWRVF